MTGMIERVARAIMEIDGCGCTISGERVFCDDKRLPVEVYDPNCICKKLSRAAIEAMREPTKEMIDARWNVIGTSPKKEWEAMITAALHEGKEEGE